MRKNLSWFPKPKDRPDDFDRTVATNTDYGRCLVVFRRGRSVRSRRADLTILPSGGSPGLYGPVTPARYYVASDRRKFMPEYVGRHPDAGTR